MEKVREAKHEGKVETILSVTQWVYYQHDCTAAIDNIFLPVPGAASPPENVPVALPRHCPPHRNLEPRARPLTHQIANEPMSTGECEILGPWIAVLSNVDIALTCCSCCMGKLCLVYQDLVSVVLR